LRATSTPTRTRNKWNYFSKTLVTQNLAVSSSSLRKFDEGDLGKEISADVANKFEIKEIKAPTPVPAPVVPEEKPKPRKKIKSVEKPALETETKSASKTPVVRRLDPMPFQVGERLSYDLRYLGVTAATFQTEILPLKQIGERKVYPIRAKAKTLSLFELVYRVDDTVESFWDFDGLYSHRFTMELDESKQKVLGAHVIVVKAVSHLAGKGEDLLCAGSKIVHHMAGIFRRCRLNRFKRGMQLYASKSYDRFASGLVQEALRNRTRPVSGTHSNSEPTYIPLSHYHEPSLASVQGTVQKNNQH
jgi:hypothetical protein